MYFPFNPGMLITEGDIYLHNLAREKQGRAKEKEDYLLEAEVSEDGESSRIFLDNLFSNA